MKFQVGDVIRYEGKKRNGQNETIVKIAEAGELVKGPWCMGLKEFELGEESYILEDREGEWSYITLEDKEWLSNFKLVERPGKTMEEKKVQKAIQRRIEDYLKRAVEAKDPGERLYYSGREDGLQDLYFELFGCYYY
jgi:hypothetical protein